jgi:hypothetical protein
MTRTNRIQILQGLSGRYYVHYLGNMATIHKEDEEFIEKLRDMIRTNRFRILQRHSERYYIHYFNNMTVMHREVSKQN